MKKNLSLLLFLFFTIFLFACTDSKIKNSENVVSFNEFVKDDNLTEIDVSINNNTFLFKVTRMVSFERETKDFTLNKDEARYVILKSLGYFSKYVVNMDEECEESLGLKLEYEYPDKLKLYKTTTPDLSPYYFYKNVIFFNVVAYEQNVPRVFVSDFIYLLDYESGVAYKDPKVFGTISRIEEQDKNNIETLPYAISDSGSEDFSLEEGYVYGAAEAYLSSRKPYMELALFDAPYVFKDGVIDYSKMSSYCIESFNSWAMRCNFKGRVIYKGFDENTTLEEFKQVLKENNLILRWVKYVDNK